LCSSVPGLFGLSLIRHSYSVPKPSRLCLSFHYLERNYSWSLSYCLIPAWRQHCSLNKQG
jgi:hypothetical protein